MADKIKEKKYPKRHCIGCGAERNKNELLRVVRTPEGDMILDKTGKHSGRGAYVCPDTKCLSKAKKFGRFESNLGIPVPEEIFSRLLEEMKAYEE